MTLLREPDDFPKHAHVLRSAPKLNSQDQDERQSQDQARAKPKVRYPLTAFDDLKLGTEVRYLVKSLIPNFGLTLIWGRPKCGKSFWAFDLVLHVALGWTYRGLKVRPGTI